MVRSSADSLVNARHQAELLTRIPINCRNLRAHPAPTRSAMTEDALPVSSQTADEFQS